LAHAGVQGLPVGQRIIPSIGGSEAAPRHASTLTMSTLIIVHLQLQPP
jgi:hypothetical protein